MSADSDHWVLAYAPSDGYTIIGIYHTEAAARLRRRSVLRKIARFAWRVRLLDWAIYHLPLWVYDLICPCLSPKDDRAFWRPEELVVDFFPEEKS